MDEPGRNPCMKLMTAMYAGVIMTLPMPPSSSAGETLDSDSRIGQQRHRSVVPSLEVLSWLVVESLEQQDGVHVGGHFEHGLAGRNGHRWRHFFVDVSSRMAQSRCSLADSQALKGGRCIGCVIMEVDLVPKTPPSIVTRSRI
jgi:hypothetical protein